MNYLEKLKDPRWQKKRLDILNRDEFTCQKCGDKQTTLHIHHIEYQRGKEPWDYDEAFLITLCAHCHAVIEKFCKRLPFFDISIHKHERYDENGFCIFFKYKWNGPRENIVSGNIAFIRDGVIVDYLIYDFEELQFFKD